MSILLDTSILGRLANRADVDHFLTLNAVANLRTCGEHLHISPQNLVEFRNFATRPKALNGLGLSSADVEALAASYEAKFDLLPDTPDIHLCWKNLFSALGVIGKQVHDARLAAVCHVHGVAKVLTFNVAHFTRFSGFGAGLLVLHPRNV